MVNVSMEQKDQAPVTQVLLQVPSLRKTGRITMNQRASVGRVTPAGLRVTPSVAGVTRPTRPNLRADMPLVTAFIDECREAFGVEEINAQIKLGMQGAQTFHASENGIEVGTRFSEPVKFVSGDQMVIRANALPAMPKK